ncbi:TonB-dependent receptor [Rufibacter sp. LB8]|uniref:SusC/RagA family TonB-linked outer membrane protein n=1 Tax=Rufibacter sp. LB8 TaxID=2777781 RepID=UPI00178C24A3|nr:TonB-dependent receptor [Rufibacter sp. LB8]
MLKSLLQDLLPGETGKASKHFRRFSSLLVMAIAMLMLTAGAAFAQQRTVSGMVRDSGGSPLIGVTVQVKGTTTATATDASGSFSLPVTGANARMVFTYIGYLSQEVAVGSQNALTVLMVADQKALDEVVVVGYGTQQRREITGSIAKVDGAVLAQQPAPSFEAALQGRAAGVQVIQGSGLAGSGSVIRIRGIGSLTAGGDPLYVVDGIPITQDPFLNGDRGAMNYNPLATINPNDIESVEVLKDVSAAAIYGSRGSNGVILITTKRGKKGAASIDFSARTGISKPTKLPDFLNNREWLTLRQEAWENDGNVGRAPLFGGVTWEDALNTNTDWLGETTQTGVKQEYSLGLNKGTEKLSLYAGLAYNDNESYLKGNSLRRMSGRLNVDYLLLPKVKVGFNTSLSQGLNDRVFAAWSGGLGAAMSTALPIYPVYNQDGSYFNGAGIGNNPVAQLEATDWKTREIRTINNAYVEFSPIENLTLTGRGGLDYGDIRDSQYNPPALNNTTGFGSAEEWRTYVTNYNLSATANYNLKMGEMNSLSFLLGSEYQRSNTLSMNERASKANGLLYTNPEVDETSVVLGAPNYQEWAFLSYFGRVNYTLADKYIVQATGRVDGSSRFGSDYRYGFFPSVGLGYIISEEDFFKDNISFVNFFKLKASWGKTGNANFDNYRRWGYFRSEGTLTYNGSQILFPVQLNRPDLAWETLNSYDLGFEFALFKNRITAEFAFYDKRSKDVLIDLVTPASAGFNRSLTNIGEVQNKGVEFSFTSVNIDKAFKWSTSFNIAHNKNEVKSIGITSPDAISGAGDTRVFVGQPVGVNYLVRFSRVDPATGAPIWLDKDGQETMTFNLDNRVIVGNVLPDFTGGITNTFSYKNFDLSVLFAFTKGGDIYDDAIKRQLGVTSDWNMRREMLDRWRKPGDIATYPKLTTQPGAYGLSSEWNYNTDLWLYDASYMRLRNLTFGYNLPTGLLEKAKVKNARIYFVGTNLLTFTKFPGMDPEIVRDHNGPQGRNLSPNVSYLTPPQEKAFTVGVDLKF